jgi:hypothetical protein
VYSHLNHPIVGFFKNIFALERFCGNSKYIQSKERRDQEKEVNGKSLNQRLIE